jgi:ferredoxin, 2Fe-2S
LPNVVFVLPGGERRTVAVRAGTSLLEAARADGIEVEGACGGSMACATCHVHVDPAWAGRLPPPSPEEEDMLDFAKELGPTSRLGCQIRAAAALDGLTVRVPRSTLLGGG